MKTPARYFITFLAGALIASLLYLFNEYQASPFEDVAGRVNRHFVDGYWTGYWRGTADGQTEPCNCNCVTEEEILQYLNDQLDAWYSEENTQEENDYLQAIFWQLQHGIAEGDYK